MGKENKVDPVRRGDFGLSTHRSQRFDATVPGTLTKSDLENGDLWSLVSPQINEGAEIRVLADDYSFVATLLVTFVKGTDVRAKIVHYVKMEEVDHEALNSKVGDYEVKLCGTKKWCIRKRDDGTIVKEGMATQLEALKELEDYERALAA
jgi:hypothetical protein